MNERILELEKQADRFVLSIPASLDINEYTAIFNEKFAELIVKECIGITDDLVNRNTDGTWTSNELYTDYNGALSEVKRRIQQHFGVEL
jgi:hypothetical protein